MDLADLGGDRLQSGLVAIRQRQVAAARGELKRQRPADAAGGAGDGGGGSTDGSHLISSPCREGFARKTLSGWQALATGRSARATLSGPGPA
jgi:hypothetical protein